MVGGLGGWLAGKTSKGQDWALASAWLGIHLATRNCRNFMKQSCLLDDDRNWMKSKRSKIVICLKVKVKDEVQ